VSDFRLFWMSERRYQEWLAKRAAERAARREQFLSLVQAYAAALLAEREGL
jgi:hypothetical protein